MPHPDADEVHRYFETLSNWGRWGDDDSLGTLNFVTPEVTVAASSEIQTGRPFDPMRRHVLKAIGGGVLVGATGCTTFGRGKVRHFDVAVVGAGPFGASTAMHLAMLGGELGIALIGPSERPGGTSAAQALASHYDESRNATAMDSDLEWAAFARDSIGPMRALEKRTGIDFFEKMGSLRVTQGRSANGYFDLDGIRKSAAQLNVELTELDRKALAERYPDARFDADSQGLLQESGAGLLNPRRLVAALRKGATAEGATWIDDEVARIEPREGHVDLMLNSGVLVRASRIVVATGASPIGHALLTEEAGGRPDVHAHLPTHVEVAEDFESSLPPAMLTSVGQGELFAGFFAPPIRYPNGRRYLKVAGQAISLVDGTQVPDQRGGVLRAVRRLHPELEPRSVESRVCWTTDTGNGRAIIRSVAPRIALAIAGNGKGAKAALEVGRRAAALVGDSS